MTVVPTNSNNSNEAVLVAAHWLADQTETPPQVVHILCTRFGLSALQACEACKMASNFRVYRRAHG